MTIRQRRVPKRLIAVAAAAAAGVTMLAIPTPTSAAPTLDTTIRLAGANRYSTAAAIATEVGCSNDIILASGENQPDALAAAALARAVQAPILLTPSTSLSPDASNVIGDCASGAAQTVHILGGESAVSASVATLVDALPNVTVNRISGPNRYETAVEIANTVGAGAIGQFLNKRTVILASGTSYVDALAAGPISYRGVVGGTNAGPHPILLTTADALPPVTDGALTSLGVQQVVIAGGPTVVSDAVQTAIEAKGITVIRVAGANRNATAAALGTVAVTPAGSGGFGFDGVNVGLANGTNAFGGFDALAAAPYLGKNAAPLILTGSLPAESAAFLTANNATITTLHVFGGTTAVSAETVVEAEAAATQSVPTATITANEGQTIVKVVFSAPVLVSSVSAAGTFSLNNVADPGVVAPAALPPATTVATDFTVTLPAPLNVGDAFRLNANTAKTAATPPVFAASTTVTVANDTTKPVATITASPNSTTFLVKFSEGVDAVAASAATSYTAAAGSGNAAIAVAGAAYDGTTFTATVTVNRALLPGDQVGNVGGVIGDLATPPNFANAASRTVLADQVAPSLTGATIKFDDATQAVATVDGGGGNATAVSYQAKAATAPGVNGNAIVIVYTNVGATASEFVTVTGTSPVVITVRTRIGGSTSAQIAAAVNGNVFSSALVNAVNIQSTPTTITAFGATGLSGGVTNLTVTATFSEVITTGGGFTTWAGPAGASNAVAPAPVITPASGTSATYTLTYSNINLGTRPAAGAQFSALAPGSFDLAGNALPGTSVTMTVAS